MANAESQAVLKYPEEEFAKAQSARWLLRLMDIHSCLNDRFFILAGWIAGGLPTLAKSLGARLLSQFTKRDKTHAQARRAVKKMLDCNLNHYDDALEEMCEANEFLHEPVKKLMREFFEQNANIKVTHPLHGRLKRIFGIDAKAQELCFFAFALNHYSEVEHYFEDTLEAHVFDKRNLLGALFLLPGTVIQDLRLSLEEMGILESSRYHGSAIRLTDSVERLLLAASTRNLQDIFCRKLPRATVAFDQFHIDADVRNHALALLAAKTSRPVHLLLYGAPGAGKSSFAATLAQELSVKAWAVQCSESDDAQDRRASLTACLKLAAKSPGAFVLVDEAERLLDTSGGDVRESSPKAWMNGLLERPNTRIIWITNSVGHLDPAVRRRFTYSICFREPDKAESLAMWNGVATRVGVEELLPAEARERFASKWRVPIATMESALRQARAHARKKNFVPWVERVIKAQVMLQHNGEEPAAYADCEKSYDPDGVCATTPVSKIISSAKKLAKRLDTQPEPGLGSMLFYGPPGSGKTALARHLARELKRDLIVKRASDLIDPYVGVTEKNIAAAFAKAANSRSLLLIDEADSFLFARSEARRSWEQTMTNEFLTQLEEFTGLCICTTNFRANLDPASMRRFTTKIEFGYLAGEQIERLYGLILSPLAADALTQEQRRILRGQKRLVPGDFQAVRKRCLWLADDVTHVMLIEGLLEEQKLKLESKTVGF